MVVDTGGVIVWVIIGRVAWILVGTAGVVVWVFIDICVIVEVLYMLKPPGCPPSCIVPKVLTGILLLFTFGTPQ